MIAIRTPSRWIAFLFALAVMSHSGGAACLGQEAGGFLQGLRSSVRVDPSPPGDDTPSKKERRGCHHNDSCDCDDLWGLRELGGWLVGFAITSPYWGPHVTLSDDFSQVGYFAERPYEGLHQGYLIRDPANPLPAFTWSARASLEHAESFDALTAINGKFLFETKSRWGIDSELQFRSEDFAPGISDTLFTGDLNLVFRFAQSERAMFRSGVGFNWLSDDVDENFGFNFTYGFDLFPAEPWILSTEFDLGTLGHASLFHVRSTAGIIVHGAEVYIGVDYFDVGPNDTTTMVSGVRVWF